MSSMKTLNIIDVEFKKYKSTTICQYRPVIKRYLIWLYKNQSATDKATLCATGLPECIKFLDAQPLQSPSQRNQQIAALSAMYNALGCTVDLSSLRARQKFDNFPEYVLPHAQVCKIIHTLNYPYKTIAFLIYASGLTISQILSLTTTDVDLDNLRAGRAEISKWIAKRLEIHLEDAAESEKVFNVSRAWFNKRFRHACRRVGLPDIITPQTLRHSGVVRLFEAGRSDAYIVQWLGVTAQTFKRRYRWLEPDKFEDVKSPLDE